MPRPLSMYPIAVEARENAVKPQEVGRSNKAKEGHTMKCLTMKITKCPTLNIKNVNFIKSSKMFKI